MLLRYSRCGNLIPCQPSKIVCVGLNYRAHAQEVNLALPKEPVIFLKPPSAALPHKGKIVRPAMSGRVDYEGEVGIVIGKMAKMLNWKRPILTYLAQHASMMSPPVTCRARMVSGPEPSPLIHLRLLDRV